ncbi:MAG: DUF1491 family protein [Alphaproteobacteria bacterium]|nr:DUF1491 family protein [Alphaproteobacteria bacterium]
MNPEDLRTPTHIWVDAKIRELSAQGIGVYVTHRGEKMGGLVLLKIVNPQAGECKLLTQQRDLDGVLGWINVFSEEMITEQKADEYISRSVARDPDLYVLELESSNLQNPFL